MIDAALNLATKKKSASMLCLSVITRNYFTESWIFLRTKVLPMLVNWTCRDGTCFSSSCFTGGYTFTMLQKRWGLSSGKNVKQTEKDLKELFPQKDWMHFHLQLTYFGREHCQARNHNPATCLICSCIQKPSLKQS